MRRAGWVYLIKSDTGHYKIGQTSNLHDRLRTFEVKLPFEITPIHAFFCHYDRLFCEKWLHEKFAAKRIRGEWFSLTNDDVEFIKSIQQENFPPYPRAIRIIETTTTIWNIHTKEFSKRLQKAYFS